MSYMWLDAKYVSLLSFRLRNFKRKDNNKWTFSCPLCGDSTTNKHKARGGVYPYKGDLLYHCHKCTKTLTIPNFLKVIDQSLYDDYIREKLLADKPPESELDKFDKKMAVPSFIKDTPLKQLRKISQLKAEHPVKQYIQRRMIPNEYHHKLFLCMKFKAWVNTMIPGKFESEANDEPRLIIPFLDKEGNMFGFQGRSLNPKSDLRYITIMTDESKPKIYGLDTVDLSKETFVVEGPIDSFFIPNCIATAGGDLSSGLVSLLVDPGNFVIIYDNEPRSPTTIAKMEAAIEKQYKICIWPDSVVEKDINDIICSGITREKLVDIIRENTYSGFEARMKLMMWKKC